MAASFADDDFDDDALDNLPASTLHALESRAFVAKNNQPNYGPKVGVQPLYATQNPAVADRPPLSTIRQAGVRKEHPGVKAQIEGGAEDVINLDDYGHSKQVPYSQFRLGTQTNRYPQQNTGQATKNGVNVPFRPPGRSSQSSQTNKAQGPPISTDLAALQAQIQKLQKEKADLKELVDGAEARAQAKTGEASILRQRIEKTTREYEHQLESLRQTQQDHALRQKAELEAVQKQREKVETDKRFLEHDLAVEVSKAKTRKVPAVVRSQTVPEAPYSPKKPKGLEFGDGFNDDVPTGSPSRTRPDQVQSFPTLDHDHSMSGLPSSPAKSWNGYKAMTPSRRPEKKRKLAGFSPARSKAFLGEDILQASSPIQLFSPDPSFEYARDDNTGDQHGESEQLDFMKSILFYKLAKSSERFFDTMKNFKFSFSPLTLSAWIMDCWDQTSASKDVAMDFCQVICNIWETCLEQKLYEPIDSIVDILHFAISKNSDQFSRALVSKIVPPIMKSVNEVAFPIASDRMDDSGPVEPVSNINTHACLDLLVTISNACEGHKIAATEFWTTLTLHWVLVLLFPMQPLHHLSMTCALLRTSAFEDSFGPIFQSIEFDSVKDQADLEGIVVDRLTSLLSIDLKSANHSQDITLVMILEFRMQVLQTLIVICDSPRTGLSIAKHPDAIGRLMQFLLEAINYLYRPDTTLNEVHDLVVNCINTSMRILYAVLTVHSDMIDIHEKLKAVDGGAHMQLLALTRIAFCESVVIEHGIDPAVSDAAHALLDEFLSPVEGDQLLKMFPSVDSTALGNDISGGGGTDAAQASARGVTADAAANHEVMDLT